MQMGSLRPERGSGPSSQLQAQPWAESPSGRPTAPQLAEGRVKRRGSWMGRLSQATGDG